MKYNTKLLRDDAQLALNHLNGFVPNEIFDIHTHPYLSSHFPEGEWAFLNGINKLDCLDHQNALKRYMPATTIHGLYFGMPRKTADRSAMNEWVRQTVGKQATAWSRSLLVASPDDTPNDIANQLRESGHCGIKVYHCYAERTDTMNAQITEYAPEWMWEILNEVQGVMMLHIVRDGGISDTQNQKDIIRLCRAYPQVKLVLAHVARSFNYRNARNGLQVLSDLDNVVVDTSAICEAETFKAALKAIGPKRLLWGSDFAISELRGRCITTGDYFFWLHPELIKKEHSPPTNSEMTLVGIESLLALKEACDDEGLTSIDIEDIFKNNALRFLKTHLPKEAPSNEESGQELWKRARSVISTGTGLLSKRAEMYDPKHWPAYYSRCAGAEVWDLSGRRFVDFAGGIGAVLLGYADPDVNAAVQRRLFAGTYCSLVNPQEVALAEKLLGLHPWAGKVRYARGGGDAMAMAIRIARATTGRSGVAFCGYHGWHDWYLAANLGDNDALDGHLLPGLLPKGVPRELHGTSVPFKYNDLESFELALSQLNENLAVVVMEPMRAHYPQDGFVTKVAARCRELGVVFIVDEITSGLRYGFPGALSQLGVEPDMVVYAKAMSNGFPFAAVVGTDEVMDAANESFISSSFWTDGVGTAAALATLEKVQRLNVQKVVWEKGKGLQKALHELAGKYPGCKISIGGMPSTPTLTFDLGNLSLNAKTFYIRRMLERGFLVSSTFYLMYAHSERQIEQLLLELEGVFKELEEVIHSGNLNSEQNTSISRTGFSRLA